VDAITMAESGDLLGALDLFLEAVREDPTNSKVHENLAVTQMRLGLINDARKSLGRAQELHGSTPSDSLKSNFAALQEHVEYAESIDHDKNALYQEYSKMMKKKGGGNKKGNDEEAEEGDPKIDEAIALAEAGDMLAALQLFEEVAAGSQYNPMSWVNVGVTQMRLGLLNKARASLNKAKNLKGGKDLPAVRENLKSLQEHVAFGKSIGHDFDDYYEEYKEGGKKPKSQGI
jgi:Flp pilus assembly protein TadD